MPIADTLKKAFGATPDEDEENIVSQVYEGATLSWATRLKGFIACFVLGVIFSLLGSFLLFLGNYIPFAVLYSLGTITSLLSTMFLMGPCNQMKKMFQETRIIATIVMLACIVMTIVSAVVLEMAGLAILFCILQFLALTWYSISFIPFARTAVKKCFSGCVS